MKRIIFLIIVVVVCSGFRHSDRRFFSGQQTQTGTCEVTFQSDCVTFGGDADVTW